MSEINYLGIDVKCAKVNPKTGSIAQNFTDANVLISKLRKLKSTVLITGPYPYCYDKHHAQVLLDTTMTEDELDYWLWKTKGIKYVGVFKRD